MTLPTQKQRDAYYRSKENYEKKLDEAMKNAPKIEELYRLVAELISSNKILSETTTKLQIIVETQAKSIDKLTCGFEGNRGNIESLDKRLTVVENSEEYENKKLAMPTAILLSVIAIIVGALIGMVVERFGNII